MSRSMEGGGREGSSRRAVAALAACAALLLALALGTGSASAAVGVEEVSRHGGRRGDEVKLTLGCGFCFPPCEGPKGHRHPEGFDRGPCMLDTKKKPPASFGISLVPRSEAPEPHECGPRALCSPTPLAPPRRAPFTFLGNAVPPPGGNDPEHGDVPRYVLEFEIPRLRPGAYAYVIWCDACAKGRRGSLIASPGSRLWRLTLHRPAG